MLLFLYLLLLLFLSVFIAALDFHKISPPFFSEENCVLLKVEGWMRSGQVPYLYPEGRSLCMDIHLLGHPNNISSLGGTASKKGKENTIFCTLTIPKKFPCKVLYTSKFKNANTFKERTKEKQTSFTLLAYCTPQLTFSTKSNAFPWNKQIFQFFSYPFLRHQAFKGEKEH